MALAEQHRLSPGAYRRKVLVYQYLPVIAALVLVAAFVTVFSLSGSYTLAAASAFLPSAVLLYRWAVAGRRIDRMGCPRCGAPFPRRLSWSYPPKTCPQCGGQVGK